MIQPKAIHYITSERDVLPAISHLLQFDILAFDTETYHTRDKRAKAVDPTTGARMRLSQWASPDGRAFVFDHFHINKRYLWRMFPNPYIIIGQNIKFDIKFLMYELGIDDFGSIWDTMTAGQIINKGNVAGESWIPVGLDDLVWRELDIELPKDEQNSDWWKPELSNKQIEYAGKDAFILHPLQQKQLVKLKNQKQIRVAELEFNTIAAIAEIELNGFRLNGDKWMANHHKTEAEHFDTAKILWSELGYQKTLFSDTATINLDSSSQVIEAFKRKGLPTPINPKTGNESVDMKLLKPFESQFPIVKTYRNYCKLKKALSSYGPKWLDFINPFDGRIHATFKGIGAETGRMSVNTPNLQQIKKEDEWREPFEASPGWVLVDADYSQMELRILAEYCRDANFLAAFDNDYDLHRYTASLIFQKAMDAIDGIMRGIAKNLNFGIVYGIGVGKFAQDAGISLTEARRIMDYYLKIAYPGMKAWLDNQAASTIREMQATTMTGRIRQYNGDLTDDKQRSQIERNGKNLPIQGTSVDITKRALYLLYRELRPYRNNIKIIHVIHDEIILEARPQYARIAEQILTGCMLKAEREYLKRVKSVVDCSTTLVWTKEANEKQKADAERLILEYT